MLMYRKKSTLSGRHRVEMSRSLSESFPYVYLYLQWLWSKGKNSQLRKSSKMCGKTLFVTVTLLSPNVLLNDSCFKIIVYTRNITENFHMAKVTFLHHSCLPLSVEFFLFKYWAHGFNYSTYVITSTLKRHWHYRIWQIVQRCIKCMT